MQANDAEDKLNQLGYDLLSDSHDEDAIAVFIRNVAKHPESSNAYDSLAEALLKTGKKPLALLYYQKALQADPKNEDARIKVKELSGAK
jgi:cytochrome c-type biogenesis protein CcmH/NrfG